MTTIAYRQAILALLERSPRSEFVWLTTVSEMLAGPDWPSFTAHERNAWRDIAAGELAVLVDAGLVEHSAHLGWRLA